jgi:dTDP-4-amino-4,6-dideoxygalactose transaminase
MNIQPNSWPIHEEDELQAVRSVLSSGHTNYWTGSECREFEKEYAAYVGTEYAIALMNGTVALEAALHALDIGPGDEVIAPSRTFIASASCIVMRGATPVIADVDINSQNITVETIKPCITSRTKAIIVVHLAGWPADMKSILELAHQYNLKVIEDCAQAHGAMIDNRHVGSWGHVAAFSFCQDKIITTGGEGGMVTTNDKSIWEKIWSYKDHGKSYEKIYHQQHPPGFRWLHDSFGTNWRMTEMQAAIGRLQLKKLPKWLQIRNENAEILTKNFCNVSPLRVPIPPKNMKHAYYKYYVFIDRQALKSDWNRVRIIHDLFDRGVSCFTGSCSEIYLEQAFINDDLKPTSIKPIAKMLGDTSLMFLIDPTLTVNDMQKAANAFLAILELATI